MAVLCTNSSLRRYKFWLLWQKVKWLPIAVIFSLAIGFLAGGYMQCKLDIRKNADTVKKNLDLREELGRAMASATPKAQAKGKP